MLKTCIVGCGSMGSGMARHLTAQGVPLTCFDADPLTREQLANSGLDVSDTLTGAVSRCMLIVLSLPRAEIVGSVMSELHVQLPAGAVVVDMSTSEPATSQRLARRAAERGYAFIDAPVSGGPAAAASGSMTMLIGGDLAALVPVEPILDLLSARRVHVGGSGAGNAAKIANNLLCAANLVLVSEALKLAEAAGVAPASLLEGVNAGSGRSAVSEVNYPRWILSEAYDSGFTMGLMRKDVRLALTLAEQSGVALPGFSGIAGLWADSSDTLADEADFNEIHRYVSAVAEAHD